MLSRSGRGHPGDCRPSCRTPSRRVPQDEGHGTRLRLRSPGLRAAMRSNDAAADGARPRVGPRVGPASGPSRERVRPVRKGPGTGERAEEVGGSLVHQAAGRAVAVDGHLADRVDGHLVSRLPARSERRRTVRRARERCAAAGGPAVRRPRRRGREPGRRCVRSAGPHRRRPVLRRGRPRSQPPRRSRRRVRRMSPMQTDAHRRGSMAGHELMRYAYRSSGPPVGRRPLDAPLRGPWSCRLQRVAARRRACPTPPIDDRRRPPPQRHPTTSNRTPLAHSRRAIGGSRLAQHLDSLDRC